MARPRKNLPADGLATIRALASTGAKETEIARALGMDRKTWARIRDEDPEVQAAWTDARAIEHDRLVDSLFRQAVGAPAELDEEGNVVRAEVKPNPASAMFLLKTRHGYREQGPSEGSGESRVTIAINLPASLKAEQYERLVEIHPQQGRALTASASEAA